MEQGKKLKNIEALLVQRQGILKHSACAKKMTIMNLHHYPHTGYEIPTGEKEREREGEGEKKRAAIQHGITSRILL